MIASLSKWDRAWMRLQLAKSLQQRSCSFVEESRLAFIPHLHERDVREARVEVFLDCRGDLVEV